MVHPAALLHALEHVGEARGVDPREVLDAARQALRRRRFRVDVGTDGSVAAEKGYLRETGNLVFHAALLLLPMAPIMVIVAPQTPRLSARFGANRTVSGGMLLLAGGVAVAAHAVDGVAVRADDM